MDTTNERMEKLLVLLLLQSMHGATQKEKVTQLNMAGFSNIEIADLLQTSPAVVATLLYQGKKSSKPRSRK